MKRNRPAAQRPSTSGFTLIEILVVVMIITLLASIVAVNVLRKPGEARISTARMQIRQLQTAIQLYRSEQGLLPSQEQGLEALVADQQLVCGQESDKVVGQVQAAAGASFLQTGVKLEQVFALNPAQVSLKLSNGQPIQPGAQTGTEHQQF